MTNDVNPDPNPDRILPRKPTQSFLPKTIMRKPAPIKTSARRMTYLRPIQSEISPAKRLPKAAPRENKETKSSLS